MADLAVSVCSASDLEAAMYGVLSGTMCLLSFEDVSGLAGVVYLVVDVALGELGWRTAG